MGTNTESTLPDTNRRRNQRHPEAFKRSVVEQSYLPGSSVARLARSHGINANQIFSWRKRFRDAGLPAAAGIDVALIPVTLSETIAPVSNEVPSKPCDDRSSGTIELDVGRARLMIRGTPDAAVLQAILARLLR